MKKPVPHASKPNAVKPIQLTYCSQCGTPAPSHVVCPTCGNYQGRTLVEAED
ncbi:MAG: 50S ribosomal protein L32 [Planctomycetaceae bacterium]